MRLIRVSAPMLPFRSGFPAQCNGHVDGSCRVGDAFWSGSPRRLCVRLSASVSFSRTSNIHSVSRMFYFTVEVF